MSTFSCWAGIQRRFWGTPSTKLSGGRTNAGGNHRRELLPSEKLQEIVKVENPGSSKQLRSFWAAFAAFDVQSLMVDKPDKQAQLTLESSIDQLLSRCILATYPFVLVLRLLMESGEDRLHTVQRILGRADVPEAGASIGMGQVESQCQRYAAHARAFKLIGAVLIRDRSSSRALQDKLQTLVAAQRLLPQEWRSA